jgi:hypothetical protein
MLSTTAIPRLMRSGALALRFAHFSLRNSAAASVSPTSFTAAWQAQNRAAPSRSISGRSFSTDSSERHNQSAAFRCAPPPRSPALSLALRALRSAERALKIEPVTVAAVPFRKYSSAASMPVDAAPSATRGTPSDEKGDTPKEEEVPRSVGYWLLGIGAMVYCMVTLGGVTRLTGLRAFLCMCVCS